MKELSISINRAQLISFGVELKEGKPVVHAVIALLTQSGEQITTYTIFSDEWHSKKFELPIEAMPLIGDLAYILEGVAVRHLMGSQLALGAPKKRPKPVTPKEADEINDQAVTNAAAEPINLDDIPF